MRLALDPPLDPEAYAWTHRVRARFAETDAMSVVHHSSYVLYMEEARVAWLRELGHSYRAMREEGVDFAVLEAFVQYRAPVRFDDVIEVHVAVGAVTRATFQIAYLLTVDGSARATAVTVHGCVSTTGRAVRMPAWIGASDALHLRTTPPAST
jgi:acyl-CoA thioester hydrolase